MVEKFKRKLKENGQNLRWFYSKYVAPEEDIDLTYSGFTAQLNGYAPVTELVKVQLSKYLKGE
jgi:hypothetical protein